MSNAVEELRAEVEGLKTAVREAVEEIHSLADQLAKAIEEGGEPEALDLLRADIKDAASQLHAAVFPPSAAKGG
jgi:hypothetical protein